MTNEQHGQNLIVVAALDGYAANHGMSALDVFACFEQHNAFNALRDNYATLHTQALSEAVLFAEDYIKRLS